MQPYSKRPRNAFGMIGPEDNRPSFSPPEGLELRGNSGQALVKWSRKPDGDICIESFDGVSLGESDDEENEEQEEKDPYNLDQMGADDGDQGP